MAERSFAVAWRHSTWARSAASIARRVSAVPHFATSATTLPLAGLSTGCVSPLSASHHLPSMYAWVLSNAWSEIFMANALVEARQNKKGLTSLEPASP